jgi:hypothetical protein
MARRIFDYRGYPTDPHDINDRFWYYVQREGLIICQRMPDGNPAEQTIIPWRKVRRALRDHDASPQRRR